MVMVRGGLEISFKKIQVIHILLDGPPGRQGRKVVGNFFNVEVLNVFY
jgi:hypothetical protein